MAYLTVHPAKFEILTKTNTIITTKEINPGVERGIGYGVIDLNGKVIIPFEEEEIGYYEDEKAYTGYNRIYTSAGKKLDFSSTSFRYVNGHMTVHRAGEYKPSEGYEPITKFFVKADGTFLNMTEKFGWDTKYAYYPGYEYSEFSTGGYVWVPNKDDTKWGLIDIKGNVILPFEYDMVDYENWSLKENGHAIVTKDGRMGLVNADGKLVIPCIYKTIRTATAYITQFIDDEAPVIAELVNTAGKTGLAEIKTGKILLPVEYDAIGAHRESYQKSLTGFEMGVYFTKKDNVISLIDKNGNVVYTTRNEFSEALDGLYYRRYLGYFDTRGRIIFPVQLEKWANLEDLASFTIYVQNGKVYRASANYLNKTFAIKPYAPEKATAVPSSTKLVVNGKNVAVDAYGISGNNYIKLRDLATMVNNTAKNFEVTWDGSKNAINLISNKAYTPVGGEMAKGDGTSKQATRTNATIFVNGGEVSMTAYTIGGNNYFKLRDVMQIFDIGVGWDATTSTATINTSESYALTASEQKAFNAHKSAYEQAMQNPYPVQKINQYDSYKMEEPFKLQYKVGETLNTQGLYITHIDVFGNYKEITRDVQLKIGDTEVRNGYKLTQAGEFMVDVYYNGNMLYSIDFDITVVQSKRTDLAGHQENIFVKKASGQKMPLTVTL